MAETKVTYFPKILSRNTSFYMLGWTPDSYDAQNAIYALLMTPAPNGQGPVQSRQLQQQARRRAGKAIASRSSTRPSAMR